MHEYESIRIWEVTRFGLIWVFQCAENRDWQFISRSYVLRDCQWRKIDVTDQTFCLADENNGRRWRWRIYECSCCTCFVCYDRCSSEDVLVSYAQHARDISIHKLHSLPEKIGLGSADCVHTGTGYTEIAVFVSCRFQSRFSAQWNTPFRKVTCSSMYLCEYSDLFSDYWYRILLHFAWVEDHEKCIVVTRSVCLSVCLSAAACPHYCTDPDVTWGSGRGCRLVVHYWADL